MQISHVFKGKSTGNSKFSLGLLSASHIIVEAEGFQTFSEIAAIFSIFLMSHLQNGCTEPQQAIGG